ncbi:hypothetical protein CTEN210_12861 [Chaetoceros tenuissimus]|uniref:Uncharacterized protein n=1 Tax=Chaetoceros tenuissimus TaxID=426638 RepID=A0AAD3D468_9STRA|nr:hypothetical protein CTEN210_12861 [Chaetoceros tenuissimus]
MTVSKKKTAKILVVAFLMLCVGYIYNEDSKLSRFLSSEDNDQEEGTSYPKSCDGWCHPHSDPWDMKCTFKHCNGCDQCLDQEDQKVLEEEDQEEEGEKKEKEGTIEQAQGEDKEAEEASSNDPVYLEKLWFGENVRVEDIPQEKPNKVDLVITYCHAEDFEDFIEYFEKMLPEHITIIHLKVMSKCNKENILVEQLKEKLIGLSRWQFSIYPLVNKGGCDLGVAHYIVDFLKEHPTMNTDDINKVVMFLKDGPRSPQNKQVPGAHYRSLENMFEISSQGRFVCGTATNDGKSVYSEWSELQKYMLNGYVRHNSAVGASGIEFTHGYENLGDFVDKDLNWSWPESSLVEVCYGGTFAFHASNLYNNENLLEDLTKVIRILEEGGDLSAVEHFMERLWAGLISKPLNEEEQGILSKVPETHIESNPWQLGELFGSVSRSY